MVGPILRPLKNGDGRAADESGHRLAATLQCPLQLGSTGHSSSLATFWSEWVVSGLTVHLVGSTMRTNWHSSDVFRHLLWGSQMVS